MKKNIRNIVLGASTLGLTLAACTNLDTIWYDKVTPDTFYQSKEDVLAALYRPFTHCRWFEGDSRWRLQEVTADQFVPTVKGSHWYNGGENHRMLHHIWTPADGHIWETWRGATMGIALAIDTKLDLEKVDYSKFKMSEQDKADHLNQLNTLVGYFYLRAIDYFGDFIIFEDPTQPVVGRRTDVKVFNHTEKLLKEAIPLLYAKEAGQKEEGSIRKGAAAVMLARLYFNAEPYIRQERYSECEQLCQDILDGKYGTYELDDEWWEPFGFENHNSKSVIWSHPSHYALYEYKWFYQPFYHYNHYQYFGTDVKGWNGIHLQPSLYPGGEKSYIDEFNIGAPFARMNNADLRKKPYRYLGGTRYEGMFLYGEQLTPGGEVILGTEEYKNEPLVLVDYVGRLSEMEAGDDPLQLASTVGDGEENTGVRLVKVPIPTNDNKELRWSSDHVVIRLEEVYYMLAECKFRRGDKAGAAALINEVRKRAFVNHEDPDPVTADNLDKYRLVNEWGIEFLGEGRRRSDLVRWEMFTTEKWWDHEPSDPSRNRYPVPTNAISGNNSLGDKPS